MPPAEYAEYHGITEEEEHEKTNMLKLLIKAPKAFWTIGLVQFFCWFAFMFLFFGDAVILCIFGRLGISLL